MQTTTWKRYRNCKDERRLRLCMYQYIIDTLRKIRTQAT